MCEAGLGEPGMSCSLYGKVSESWLTEEYLGFVCFFVFFFLFFLNAGPHTSQADPAPLCNLELLIFLPLSPEGLALQVYNSIPGLCGVGEWTA